MRGMLRVGVTRGTLWAALIALGLAVLGSGASDAAGAASYLYMLHCDGSYLKVDTAADTLVMHGNFLQSAAIQALDLARPNGDNGWCPVFSAKYDPKAGMVYVEVESARQANDKDLEASVPNVWLLALRLPDFSLVTKAAAGGGALVVNPDSEELLVNQEDDTGAKAVAQYVHYTIPQLQFLRSEPTTSDVDGIDDQAYWWSEGQRIIDGANILNSNGKSVKYVTLDDVLTPEVHQQFQSLNKPCQGGPAKGKRQCLGGLYADSEGGRMLFIVQPDDGYTPRDRERGVALQRLARYRHFVVSPGNACQWERFH